MPLLRQGTRTLPPPNCVVTQLGGRSSTMSWNPDLKCAKCRREWEAASRQPQFFKDCNDCVDVRNIAVAKTRSHAEAAMLVGPGDPQFDFMRFMACCEEGDAEEARRRRRRRRRRQNSGYDCGDEDDDLSDQEGYGDDHDDYDGYGDSGSDECSDGCDDDDDGRRGTCRSRKPQATKRSRDEARVKKRPSAASAAGRKKVSKRETGGQDWRAAAMKKPAASMSKAAASRKRGPVRGRA